MADRRDPFEEIERLFDQMSRLGPDDARLGGASDTPPVDVIDEGGAFVVVVDLPGFESDDIDVQLREDRRLSISASREQRGDIEDGEYVRHERRTHRVDRTVSLPEPVDEGKTRASYENGLLTVRLGKRRDDAEGTEISVN